MIRRIGLAFALLLVLLIALGYNVWRANQDAVVAPPGELETGRQYLRAQLQAAAQTEMQIEKQDWDSPTLLEQVIQAHRQRLDKLAGNSQAGEIVAHDREAIDRLQKRIAELHAQAAAIANPPEPLQQDQAPAPTAQSTQQKVPAPQAAAPRPNTPQAPSKQAPRE